MALKKIGTKIIKLMFNYKNFLNKNYYLVTPRTSSFGGVMDMYIGIKSALIQKKKIVLAVPFLVINPNHKKKKLFGLNFVNCIFKKLDFLSKILSIIFTLILNLNLILIKFRIIKLFDVIFFSNKKILNKYFPLYFGYYFQHEIFANLPKDQKLITINEFNYKEFLKDITDFLPPKKIEDKSIIFFVKDINYYNEELNRYFSKGGSVNSIAQIENYRESLNLLTKKNYKINRTGDNTAKKFDFSDKLYFDSTNRKSNNLHLQYQSYLNSEFYLGGGGSTLTLAGSLGIPRIISNADIEYLWHPTDFFSKRDIIIFKKLFCKKSKKILSLQEILNLDPYDLNMYDNFLLIDNSQKEITELTKLFLDPHHNNEDNFSMSKEFHELYKAQYERLYRLQSTVDFNQLPGSLRKAWPILFKIYGNNYYKVPNFFLEKYLYPSESLTKESLEIKI